LIVICLGVFLIFFAARSFFKKRDLLEVSNDYEEVTNQIEVALYKQKLYKHKQTLNSLLEEEINE
ncbi:hypothetical protein, partial [Burkholderia vietnamiensis]|uniref:hypothetical protein n=1 Tax=Burkholderia vietnamiensis TaxID=60552 RepID=UPI00352FD95E